MSAGRVFDRAFTTIRHNPGVTLGLALLFGAIPGLFANYMVSLAQRDMIEFQSTSMMTGMIALSILSVVFGLVVTALVQGVLTRATVAESEGRKASLGECVGAALAVLPPLIVLSILLAIAVGIGLMLLIVPGIMLYMAWCVAAPALVEERRGVFASFRRSRELTKGARWKIFGIMLVLFVVFYIISGAIGFLGFAMFDFGSDQMIIPEMPPGFIALNVVASTLVNVFWGTAQASLYVELRDWKDGPATENLEEVFA